MFFVSWVLWQQMTFVLALAILTVCFAGYIKLLWTNRIVSKQEVVDEEKRMKIQELRRTGQIVESQKNHEIPFGVRAIQSGIQVDGIWISQANTPAVSNLRLGLDGTSPDILPSPDPKSGIVKDVRPLTNQATQPQYFGALDILRKFDNTQTLQEASDEPHVRGAYRPRKASHLKHGIHGEFDQTTLHHLEGTSAQKKVHVHRPRHSSSRHAEIEGESSAADNELSSSVSSRSDASLSKNMHFGMDVQDEALLKSSTVVSETEVQSPAHVQSSRVEYIETVNPFQTPLASPTCSGIPLISFDNYEDLSRQRSQAQASFLGGELHLNRTVRKVNSGFEVLPAGTFGVPTELKGKGLESDLEEDSGEWMQSAKLQKKPRTSMTGRRTSTGIERL